jgi:2-polyprenyl-6-methoxyphenol hydroxylase-like FAD-dependent oxidoreductase
MSGVSSGPMTDCARSASVRRSTGARVATAGESQATPDIGQGACLAIEDAAVLASTMDEHDIDTGLRATTRLAAHAP